MGGRRLPDFPFAAGPGISSTAGVIAPWDPSPARGRLFPQPLMSPCKPGHRTTEFWTVVVTALAAAGAAVADKIPPKWALAYMAGMAGLYSLARGLAKLGAGTDDDDDQGGSDAPSALLPKMAAVALVGLPILLAASGCQSGAGAASGDDACTKAVAAYQLYQTSLATGREVSKDERTAATIAATYLQLRCGWTPAATRGPAAEGDVPVLRPPSSP